MLRLTRQPAADPVTDLGPYEVAVAQALRSGFRWMYFSSHLEQLFEYETQHERSRRLVAVGVLWIALGLLSVIALSSGDLNPSPFGMNRAIQLGLVTPILVGVIFAIWWGVKSLPREFLIMVASIVTPASMIIGVMSVPGADVGANRGAVTVIILRIHRLSWLQGLG